MLGMNTHPLKKARLDRSLTIKDVADAIGTDAANVCRIENGNQMPGYKLALKLLPFFDNSVSMDDILKNYNPKKRKRTVKKADNAKQSDTNRAESIGIAA